MCVCWLGFGRLGCVRAVSALGLQSIGACGCGLSHRGRGRRLGVVGFGFGCG